MTSGNKVATPTVTPPARTSGCYNSIICPVYRFFQVIYVSWDAITV